MDEKKEIDEEEKVKRELLRKGEISLILDTYDDIFSDFDPRPFDRRALSDDFLSAAKKAALDKEGALELRFLIPRAQQNVGRETTIRQRLRAHFRRHSEMLQKEIALTKKKGIVMAIMGIAMIVVASYLLSLSSSAFWVHVLIVILEPAGWFTAWTGMDEIYYTTRQKKPDMDFYEKMARAPITFCAY